MELDRLIILLLRERVNCMNRKPNFDCKSKWEDLKPIQRELASTSFKKKSMRFGESKEVLDFCDEKKMYELKEIALRNYVNPSKLNGNKSWKKTWAKAVVKTKEWGFNTFVVDVKRNKKHPLCGQVDVLLMIQDFI